MKNRLFGVLFALVLFTANLMAMPTLTYDITIGNYKLSLLEKVTIETSQELLSDACNISLPGMVAGRAIQIEDKVKRGDIVTVKLGYDGDNIQEFKGYLKAIYPDTPMLLECEDSVYLFRKTVGNKILTKVGVKDILNYVLTDINKQVSTPFKLVTDLSKDSYAWDKFTILNATGFEVLDKLRKESGLLIYVRGDELHCHLAYTQNTGRAIYDFAVNIESTNNLRYVSAKDEKVKVVVNGRTEKGAKLEVEQGEAGGDVITLQRPTISDKATLEAIAKEEVKRYTYDGYRGEIVGWLVPYCNTGYSVVIRDADYSDREGTYYVTGTKVEFSQNGGIRTVSLGAKIS